MKTREGISLPSEQHFI